MRRFEALLEAHYLQHWKVADYARALAVTPTHLSRVARAATGAPVSRLRRRSRTVIGSRGHP